MNVITCSGALELYPTTSTRAAVLLAPAAAMQHAPATDRPPGLVRGQGVCSHVHPHPRKQKPPIYHSKRFFIDIIGDYVFMFFAPSFLRSRGGAVTRIRKSSFRRLKAYGKNCKDFCNERRYTGTGRKHILPRKLSCRKLIKVMQNGEYHIHDKLYEALRNL